METETLRTRIERLKGEREVARRQLKETRNRLIALEGATVHLEQAQALVQKVAQETQQELEYRVSELTSLALEAVFDDPYRLKLAFELKRGRTEAVLSFERNGQAIDPMAGSGVGAVDIASFALRLTLWSLAQPRSAPVVVLDEPFKFLSRNYQEQAGLMLKEVVARLGIQIIMVTHETDLVGGADKVVEVSIRKGVSQVEGAK